MNEADSSTFSEDELDMLVSIAIRRAELLEDACAPAASEAWLEVMVYEERLAKLSDAADIAGGIARVGAVRAALAAGQRSNARELARVYCSETSLPAERRAAIQRAFDEDRERRARRFPAAAKSGRLDELDEWREKRFATQHVFPIAV